MISLLLKNFKITKLLCTSSLEMKNTFGNEVVLKQCITLLSIVIDLIHIIEHELNEDVLLDIFKFICDLMKIFYNEGNILSSYWFFLVINFNLIFFSDSNSELSKELDAIFN